MIIGIGTDIVHTHVFQAKGNHCLIKYFTEDEIKYCESKKFPHRHYAARWAAKEAFIKAFGLAMSDGMKNIEVRHSLDGKPIIRLYGSIRAEVPIGTQIHVSLSHTSECATAVVVAEN